MQWCVNHTNTKQGEPGGGDTFGVRVHEPKYNEKVVEKAMATVEDVADGVDSRGAREEDGDGCEAEPEACKLRKGVVDG